MKYPKIVLLITVLCMFGYLLLTPKLQCFAQQESNIDQDIVQNEESLWGEITEILQEKELDFDGEKQLYQKLKINISKGSLKGEDIIVENGALPSCEVISYEVGDKVIISYSPGTENNDVFFIVDFVRTNGLLILFILFIILAVLVGSKKGALSLISMLISFVIIFTFILPNIQQGKDPVLITILASIVIIPVTFYLSHGFEKRITISIIGTIIALIITGILSNIFVDTAHLTGTASEEVLLLQILGDTQYNLKGLLLAGIIIGTLGVLDDVTVSQTAIVYQLNDLKKDLTSSELFKRSIKVGKDHIASMVNTLILVYTGTSMPLLLLFMNDSRPFGEIINIELISTEIVRTLVGSIGLILAVPITTYLACVWIKRKKL
jgi:uncharacterized membrane protein